MCCYETLFMENLSLSWLQQNKISFMQYYRRKSDIGTQKCRIRDPVSGWPDLRMRSDRVRRPSRRAAGRGRPRRCRPPRPARRGRWSSPPAPPTPTLRPVPQPPMNIVQYAQNMHLFFCTRKYYVYGTPDSSCVHTTHCAQHGPDIFKDTKL